MTKSAPSNINTKPRQTVENLIRAFGKKPLLFCSNVERTVPIGIEIEVPWRAYFPDLWCEGFPNVEIETLQRITDECTRRERVLIPKLRTVVECGIPSGADKYWEFAFEPVTDVSILCNQVELLCVNDLIPPGHHSLHITLGGLPTSRNVHYIAMILEAYSCDVNRLRTGYAISPEGSAKGWARKGAAGLFQKEGEYDLLHGYEIGAEIRMLYTPIRTEKLFFILNTAQTLADIVKNDPDNVEWRALVSGLNGALAAVGLPDENWGRPRANPQLWERIASEFTALQLHTRELFQASPLCCSDVPGTV